MNVSWRHMLAGAGEMIGGRASLDTGDTQTISKVIRGVKVAGDLVLDGGVGRGD